MIRLALVSLMTAGMVGSFAATDSLAVFTDTKINAANTFSSGILSIANAPASAVITLANMTPGDFVVAPLVVTNNGTLPLRYAMSTSATNTDAKGLAGQLQLTIRIKGPGVCADEDGAILFGPAALNTGFLGSNAQGAQGAQAGDRALAAAANETLCFKVEMPVATGNAFQDATTTATFTLDAEQTANNP